MTPPVQLQGFTPTGGQSSAGADTASNQKAQVTGSLWKDIERRGTFHPINKYRSSHFVK